MSKESFAGSVVVESATDTATAAEPTETAAVPASTETPAPPVATATTEAVADPVLEQEADSPKPDADISEAGRRLRANRSDVRKAKIQAEIDGLTKEKHKTRTEIDAERAELARLKTEREALTRPAGTPATTPETPAVPAAPTFKFSTWEEWQEKHPDSSFTDFTDERSDARDVWKEDQRQQAAEQDQARQREEQRQAQRTEAVTAIQRSTETFKATHADFDEVVNGIEIDMRKPQAVDLQSALIDAKDATPAIQYFLGTHQDELDKLLAAPTRSAFNRLFGQIELKATQASAPAGETRREAPAAPPAPAPVAHSPVTNAPAPMAPLGGGAATSRSLQAIAADSENADAYIAIRKQQTRAVR